MSAGKVETTIRHATEVDAIEEAFAFVIGHMDADGISAPTVSIRPFWRRNEFDETFDIQRFEVSISGSPSEAQS